MTRSEYDFPKAVSRKQVSKRYRGYGITISILWFALGALPLSLLLVSPVVSHGLPKVLILDSYHHGYNWSEKEISGFLGRMREVYPLLDPPVEHLDEKRHPGEDNLVSVKNLLKEKYSGQKIDLLVAFDNPALELLIRYGNELFPGTPIVFGGINDFSPAMLQGHREVTGVAEKMDDEATVNMALKLHPNTKEVLVIHDYTNSGLAVRKEFEEILPQFSNRVRFRFLPPTTFEEAVKEISSLLPDSLGIILTYTTDRLGRSVSLTESTRMFGSSSLAPIYSMHETRLGHGIVGGQLIGGIEHGRKVADIALKVLAGEKPESVPVDMSGGSRPMFDHAQMERFGIPLNALPLGSTVINKPDSFYERYRTLTISTIIVVVTLSLLVIGLAASLHRLRRTQTDLQKSEEQYRHFVETANEGVWAMDGEYRTTFVNRRMAEMLGYSVEEMVGRPVAAFFFDEDLSDHEQNMELRRQGKEQAYERRFRRKDGSTLWSIVSATALKNLKGNFAGSVAMFTDITDRKKAEEALRESEARYRAVFDNASIGINLVDGEGRSVKVNEALLHLLGYSEEEFGQLTFLDITYPDDREISKRNLEALTAGEIDSYGLEKRYLRKDGSIVWGDLRTSAIRDANGKHVGTVGVIADTTQGKKAKEELRQQRDFLQQLIDTIPAPIFYKDASGRYLGCNKAFESDTGICRADIVGKTAFDVHRPDLAEIYHEQDLSLLRSQGVQQGEAQRRDIEGHMHEVMFTKATFSDLEGNVAGLVGVIVDITDRKRAEQTLQEREQQYRLLTENTLDVIWQMDLNLRFTYVNPAIFDVTGLTPEDWIGTNLAEHCDEDKFMKMAQVASQEISRGADSAGVIFETVLLKKNRVPVPVEIRGRVILGNDGLPAALQGVARDVTERRRAEDALRESQEKYRMIFEHAPLGILHFDHNGVMLDFNDKFVEMIGAPREKLIGFNMPERQKDERMRQAVLDALAGKTSYYEGDYLSVTGGKLTPMRAFYSPVLTDDGRFLGAVGIFEDMTERKRQEDALLKSEERYKAMFRIASVGIDLVDEQGRFLEANGTLSRILGYTQEELRHLTILDVTHPEDVSKSGDMHEAMVRGEMDEYRLEKRYVRKDGEIIWSDTAVSVIRDPDGTYRATVGVIRDITQRKKSVEDRIRLAAAVEQAAETVVITDSQGIILYANPAFERTTGYAVGEALGNNPRILKSGHQDDAFYKNLWGTISDGRVWSGHFINKKKDGGLIEEDASISPVKADSGKIVNYVAVKRDVTHEVSLQKQLLQAQKMEAIGTLAGGVAHDFNNGNGSAGSTDK
jgi:PAS domain S-box-containing protein